MGETMSTRTIGTQANRPADDPSIAEEAGIGIDQIFEILKNPRRRYVLRYVEATDKPASLSDLAEEVAAYENDKTIQQITSQERKRVYVGLYQVHLPKMDDRGVIEFDQPRGTIEKGENFELVQKYLPGEGDGSDESWARFHGAMALFAVVLASAFGLAGVLGGIQLLEPILLVLIGGIALISVIPFAQKSRTA